MDEFDTDYHYVECACHAEEHVLRFTIDTEDAELVVSTYLNHWEPWYKRIVHAVRYIFGYKSKYGDFDCTLISGKEVVKLRDLCNKTIACTPSSSCSSTSQQ